MYSTTEHTKEYLNQYGTNEYKDLSNLTISIDDLPSTILVLEPALERNPVPEPDTDPTSRLSLSSLGVHLTCLFCLGLLTCFVSNNLHLLFVGDMGKLSEVCDKKSKVIRSEKTCRWGQKKTWR